MIPYNIGSDGFELFEIETVEVEVVNMMNVDLSVDERKVDQACSFPTSTCL